MYNTTKYLVQRIIGLVAIAIGAISLFISVLALLTFTKSCVGMTFNQLGFLLVLTAKSAADVFLIKKGLASLVEPKRLLASENEGEKRYKWYYVEKEVNLAIMIAAAAAIVVTFVDFFVFNSLAIVFGNLAMIIVIVYCVIYAVLIALELFNDSIKDENFYDKNGDLLFE